MRKESVENVISQDAKTSSRVFAVVTSGVGKSVTQPRNGASSKWKKERSLISESRLLSKDEDSEDDCVTGGEKRNGDADVEMES